MVAQTIFQQLRALTPAPIIMSWGASKFQGFRENQIQGIGEFYLGGLMFYVRGAKHKGHVLITLAGNDTYTITLGNVRKGVIQPKKQFKNVYFDEMSEVIDEAIEKQDFYQY